MQNHISKMGITVVTMRTPACGTQVNFHVASPGRVVTDLNDRTAKIRAALDTDESRVKYSNHFAVGGFKAFTQEALVLPGGL